MTVATRERAGECDWGDCVGERGRVFEREWEQDETSTSARVRSGLAHRPSFPPPHPQPPPSYLHPSHPKSHPVDLSPLIPRPLTTSPDNRNELSRLSWALYVVGHRYSPIPSQPPLPVLTFLQQPIDFDGDVNLFHFVLLRCVGKGAFGKVSRLSTALTPTCPYLPY